MMPLCVGPAFVPSTVHDSRRDRSRGCRILLFEVTSFVTGVSARNFQETKAVSYLKI
jgi:hypothetical protein